MTKQSRIFAIVPFIAILPDLTSGHAYLAYPESRNLVKHFEEGDFNCAHCLQAGGPTTVKAKAGGHWPTKDVPGSHGLCGNPWQHDPIAEPTFQQESFMQPTAVKATLTAGGTVDIIVAINAHHRGHFEFRICDQVLSPEIFASAKEGQACLDKFVLERADLPSDCVVNDPRDNCVPLDPKHPGRWYLPPAKTAIMKAGEDWDDEKIDTTRLPAATELRSIKYKVPANLRCEKCTLQWYWSTANTCLYDADYLTYFRDLHAKGWSKIETWALNVLASWATPDNVVCSKAKFAEEFWNCADISVVGDGPTPPTPKPAPEPEKQVTPAPPPDPQSPCAPVTPPPTPVSPGPAPVTPPPAPVTPAPAPITLAPSPEPAPVSGGPCHQKQCGCPDAQGHFPDATVDWCTLQNAPKSGNEWCHASAEQCSQCGDGVYCTGDNPRPNPRPTPNPSQSQAGPGGWVGANMQMTHYWDCSGQGCDAATLQPWDENKYISPPGYGPQDPNDFGGAAYGEKMWLTGAASDALSELMGDDDGCCGADPNDGGVGGCGKCMLVQNPETKNPDWTAVVMKKNRCPPWSNGCAAGEPHFDVAAPGFDNLKWSTANICGLRPGTGFDNQSQSEAVGNWWSGCADTAECAYLCDELPEEFRKGCKLFASWGWKRGDPSSVKFKAVDCPRAFVEHIGAQFGPGGPATSDIPVARPRPRPRPRPTEPEPEPEPEPQPDPTPAPGLPSGEPSCRNPHCGCPPFTGGKDWCKEDNSNMGSWCAKSEANCKNCKGEWCTGTSLAQVQPAVAKIHKHRNFRGVSMLEISKSLGRHFGEDEYTEAVEDGISRSQEEL